VDIPTIRAVRVSAMGPLGGIGDAIFWFTLVPITAGITSNMAISGSIAAPFIFLIIFNVVQFVVRFWLMNWSYKMGTNAISMLTENAKEFTRAASILGVFVVGCLTVCYGGTKLGLLIPNGTTNTATAESAVVTNQSLEAGDYDTYLFGSNADGSQGTYKEYTADAESVTMLTGTTAAGDDATAAVTDLGNGSSSITFIQNVESAVNIDIQSILDGICPKLIPLGITMLLYMLMAKKNWSPIKCICLVLAIGLVGSGFGLWVSIW
jgi:PTS system N-acetylgalactosamine-specific IID component